jgi:hypothetical protein
MYKKYDITIQVELESSNSYGLSLPEQGETYGYSERRKRRFKFIFYDTQDV